jgi:nicotinate-nucleotide--dimethylbenzimidazole phosphoribosyltransferase
VFSDEQHAAVPGGADADAVIFEDTPGNVLRESTQALSIVQLGVDIRPGMDLPIHDDEARAAAEAHLSNLELPGSGLGSLARIVVFAAGTQGRGVPVTWRKPQMFLLNGIHEGNIAAGDDVRVSASVAEAARRGEGPIGLLAGESGVAVRVVEAPTAGDIAYGEATTREMITDQLREGWRLTDEAVDSGADLIIVGSCGAGAEATAAVVTSRITGGEIAALLGRVVGPDGKVDDASWMLRAATARDALHRSRNSDLNADTILAELGGPDFAIIAGIILGATARRTPVLLDGPVGTAAALLARDLGSQSRLWAAIADYGSNPTTKAAADVLGLNPLIDLRVGLGEGSGALLALPLLRSALTLASTLPVRPTPTAAPPGFEDFVA